MVSREEVASLVANLLAIETPLDQILPTSDDRWDAVQQAIGRTAQTPPRKGPHEHGSVHARIYHLLGHPNLDIHDPFSVRTLQHSYVFPPASADGPGGCVSSREEAEKLVDAIVAEAKRQRELSVRPLDAKDLRAPEGLTHCFVIHGPRGCGKTFLLSHLQATFADRLNREKTIWARVDASGNLDPSETLYERVSTKLVKLLFRYFDKESKHASRLTEQIQRFPVSSDVRALIEAESDPRDRSGLLKQLGFLRYLFGRTARNVPLTHGVLSQTLREMCVQSALRAGFSLVAVIDGMDRLEATPEAGRLYDRLRDELRAFAVQYPSGFVILVVCRTSSLASLWSQDNPHYLPREQQRAVQAPTVDVIVERRREVVTETMEQIARENHVQDFDEAAFTAWKESFEQFVPEIPFSEIKELLPGPNRRAQMQVVQRTYLEWLLHTGGYQVAEILALAGRCFPPRYFEYRIERRGTDLKWAARKFDPVQVDHRFIPALFAFPDLPELEVVQPGFGAHVMLFIRILQVLEAHQLVRGGQVDPDDGLELGDLCRIMELFHFDRRLVACAISELQEFELVHLSGGVVEFSTIDEKCLVVHLPRARTLLQTLLFEMAYLNLAAMRFPLRRDPLWSEVPLVRAMNVEGTGRNFVREWVATKILNAIAVARLCRSLNEIQSTAFDSDAIASLDEPLREIVAKASQLDMFTFHDRMVRSVTRQCLRSVTGLPEDDQVAIVNRLRRYADHWGQVG